MQAATLHCPGCGAPADPGAGECPSCHARVATVACPHCFGLVFLGMERCPHCADAIARDEVADDAVSLACPRCAGEMRPVQLGSSRVRECPGCLGLWVDNQTFLSICVDRERQAEVGPDRPAAGTAALAGAREARVKYLRCPVCRAMMDRINFARVSGVVVDVCADHGTWFDRNELHRIVDFIAAGGLDRSLAHMRDTAFELRLREVVGQVTAFPGGPWSNEQDAWSALFSHFSPHAGR